MDKIYQLLKCLKENPNASQRNLANASGYSLGMVNSLLRSMEEEAFIRKTAEANKTLYVLTNKGKECVENVIRERQLDKLNVSNSQGVDCAVILAAGGNTDFKFPVGMLEIGEKTLLDRTIESLIDKGIKKIVMVVGYQKETLIKQYSHYSQIQFIENNRYKWTGTMASLVCVKEKIDSDFLLIESDYVYETRLLTQLLNNPSATCMVVNAARGTGDEAYVELNEDASLYKISKDIHEINSIDATCTGIHKIDIEMYHKMCKLMDKNNNPYLNYEYVLESLARIYSIPTLMIDDCICLDVDNQKQYQEFIDTFYPILLKREQENNLVELKTIFTSITQMQTSDILNIQRVGGMTNTNYKIDTKSDNYILRMPGKCTETMISRSNEKNNGKLGYLLGLNVDTIYFDEYSGIKLSKYIEGAETLTPSTAKLEENMKLTAGLLNKLHTSGYELKGEFNPFNEIKKYEKIMNEQNVTPYPGYREAREFYDWIEMRLAEIKLNMCSCHCDLVAENLIKDHQNRMYLVDWEYSGMNDPMWDLAAHFIECEFNEDEEELFCQYYQGNIDKEKIDLYKISQDILWSAWTMAKEANGEDFGNYGVSRLNRALKQMGEYQSNYERK